ncbi:hypothetical protein [Streptomyces sp. NPDC002573]|uniref:hypothetical protein n=1 Tax=Streptomyces sp. NPDC002573 TaxID=3364651 RepID=UPI0036D0C362
MKVQLPDVLLAVELQPGGGLLPGHRAGLGELLVLTEFGGALRRRGRGGYLLGGPGGERLVVAGGAVCLLPLGEEGSGCLRWASAFSPISAISASVKSVGGGLCLIFSVAPGFFRIVDQSLLTPGLPGNDLRRLARAHFSTERRGAQCGQVSDAAKLPDRCSAARLTGTPEDDRRRPADVASGGSPNQNEPAFRGVDDNGTYDVAAIRHGISMTPPGLPKVAPQGAVKSGTEHQRGSGSGQANPEVVPSEGESLARWINAVAEHRGTELKTLLPELHLRKLGTLSMAEIRLSQPSSTVTRSAP